MISSGMAAKMPEISLIFAMYRYAETGDNYFHPAPHRIRIFTATLAHNTNYRISTLSYHFTQRGVI